MGAPQVVPESSGVVGALSLEVARLAPEDGATHEKRGANRTGNDRDSDRDVMRAGAADFEGRIAM